MRRLVGLACMSLAVAACATQSTKVSMTKASVAPVLEKLSEAECEKYDGFAWIPEAAVHKRRLLGEPRARSRSIRTSAWFATQCSVVLDEQPSGNIPQDDCGTADSEMVVSLKDAKMEIREDLKNRGRFRMTLSKGGKEIEVAMQPEWYGSSIDDNGVQDLYYFYDALEGVDSMRRKYFVYFEDYQDKSTREGSPLKKKYWVQVYYPVQPDSGSYKCPSHMPSFSATYGSRNDTHLPSVPRQGGVGGGTEPGPR